MGDRMEGPKRGRIWNTGPKGYGEESEHYSKGHQGDVNMDMF